MQSKSKGYKQQRVNVGSPPCKGTVSRSTCSWMQYECLTRAAAFVPIAFSCNAHAYNTLLLTSYRIFFIYFVLLFPFRISFYLLFFQTGFQRWRCSCAVRLKGSTAVGDSVLLLLLPFSCCFALATRIKDTHGVALYTVGAVLLVVVAFMYFMFNSFSCWFLLLRQRLLPF